MSEGKWKNHEDDGNYNLGIDQFQYFERPSDIWKCTSSFIPIGPTVICTKFQQVLYHHL